MSNKERKRRGKKDKMTIAIWRILLLTSKQSSSGETRS